MKEVVLCYSDLLTNQVMIKVTYILLFCI